MVLSEKSNKRTKSHSVKKSEIFCCLLNFEIHFRKRKNLRKRRVYAGFGADSRTRTDGLRITNALLFPQKHSRTARLERFALPLVSSSHYARFIIHRMRSQLRPLRNIVALLAWSASHCSLFLHLIMLASSSTGRARNFVQLSRSAKPQSKNKRQR